jgi:hypothetical protein
VGSNSSIINYLCKDLIVKQEKKGKEDGERRKLTSQTIRVISDPQIELERKIDAITKLLSRPYFNTILKDLSKINFENSSTICNYIYTEQIELNIKNSTKEGKIKAELITIQMRHTII